MQWRAREDTEAEAAGGIAEGTAAAWSYAKLWMLRSDGAVEPISPQPPRRIEVLRQKTRAASQLRPPAFQEHEYFNYRQRDSYGVEGFASPLSTAPRRS